MNLQISNKQNKFKIDKRKIRASMRKIMNALNCDDKELSICFVDDKEIRKLNKQYLGKDRPTNVLSFSMQENKYSNINPHVLGDIVISVERAKKNSAEGGLTFSQEIDFLLISLDTTRQTLLPQNLTFIFFSQ